MANARMFLIVDPAQAHLLAITLTVAERLLLVSNMVLRTDYAANIMLIPPMPISAPGADAQIQNSVALTSRINRVVENALLATVMPCHAQTHCWVAVFTSDMELLALARHASHAHLTITHDALSTHIAQ